MKQEQEANPSAESEVFWQNVRRQYPEQRPLLNLNNAAVSPTPLPVEDAVVRAFRFVGSLPDVNMWEQLDANLPDVKRQLASLIDCAPEEIALNRNASEGLANAIFGIALKRNDEVLIADWDYPSVRAAWAQRKAREGIEVTTVKFDLMDDDEEIIAAYRQAISPKTRAIQLTHMIHWTGRVLPVQRLCAIAASAGIITIVDGAQSFAQMPVSFREIGCDFFATSLHKWLGAPVGNGMLIVKQERIDETWPLLAPFDDKPEGIAKFDQWNLGTYNCAIQAGILPALRFHQSIGTARIQARLQTLTKYWISAAASIKGFRLHTPIDAPELSGVSLFSIANHDAKGIEARLRSEYQIHVKYRRIAHIEGLRVSPHIYMLEAELDRFVGALAAVTTRPA
ncbi:aminotransferase class V-fold PLP-dependent enzyme [Pandoraea bronchicola]|uniref:Cysteine desulfurase n=1 Tax=Pandoraea bronchicola TaxID=2508287 RepID=A0A5E5BZG9_9BURK|nr:aminotransferase class V-fold PLP-dependent enzyme [Pandoraea bronchicola]VVE90736.1 cysteine desulfurase [Pandoraea bronchicola]